MCGIVAMYSRSEPVLAAVLTRAAEMLSHRGPDRRKTWLSEDQRVGLGHARLSIIDLVTGDQPLTNETGELRLVVNGELYDYQRIRRDLISRGHTFRTQSDSEIALHLYEEHGLELMSHLRGEYALVLWDGARKRLIAVRDRFGVKPLYYAQRGDRLYLASEVKGIFAAGYPAAWDAESTYQHLMLIKNTDRTLFEGVRQVPPAHFLVAGPTGVEVKPYWDLDYPRLGEVDEELESRSEARLIEELRHQLEESVRIRLVADVPVGCYLSGGVDSSVVMGIASRHSAEPLHAFTVSFDDRAYDERETAEETAKWCGAIFRPLPLGQADFAAHLSDAAWHAETLGTNANGVARFLQSRAVRDAGHRVVLSGDGGDELFAGYVHFRLEKMLHEVQGADDRQRAAALEELRKKSPHDFTNILLPGFLGRDIPSLSRKLGFTPMWIQGVDANRTAFRHLLRPDFAAQFANHDVHGEFLAQFDLPGQLAGRHPVLQALYLMIRSFVPNQFLYADRLDMAHGVEVRTPLFDHKLFEAVRNIPISLLFRGTQEKYSLREAGRPYLTETVYGRTKQPFMAPESTLDPTNELYQMIRDRVRSDTFRRIPFFDDRAMTSLLDRLPSMERDQRLTLDVVLILVLSACVLQERLLDSSNQPGPP